MREAGTRIGVIGATGVLGGEVLSVLAGTAAPVAGLVPVATERSLGREIEWRGQLYPVETELADLQRVDLLLLCAPADASLEFARRALHAAVPCVDVSGALAAQPDVPLRVAGRAGESGETLAPLVSSPDGVTLSLERVLRALEARAGVERAAATVLEAASSGGRSGIDALYEESLALFNQQDAPEPGPSGQALAFDCLAGVGPLADDGSSPREAALRAALGRLLGAQMRISVACAQVPVFVGHGAVLALETREPLSPSEARETLAKAPGVTVEERAEAASTRGATGREAVLVGRVRSDASSERGLLLWLAADSLRLAAANAVGLAAAHLRAR